MMNLQIAICALAALAGWFAVTRHTIQMFQQNSYRSERFLRQLRRGGIFTFRRLAMLACAACALSGIFWAAAAIAAAWAAKELRTRYKVPIVYTAPACCLFAASLALWCAISAAVWIATGSAGAALTAAFVQLCLPELPLFLLAAAAIPVQAVLNRRRLNAARSILRAHGQLTVIGITGSYGKTSTKNYLLRILSERYDTLATPGNFNTLPGVIRTIREQLKPNHRIFIVEMGAKQKGDIKEICDLVHPQIGIVTSVGEMHLETFGSVDNVRSTKFELLRSLPADGTGIVNLDSEGIAGAELPANCRIITYGMKAEGTDYRAVGADFSPRGSSFAIERRGLDAITVQTPLAGGTNILNITGAMAAADAAGVPDRNKIQAAARLQPVLHRLSVHNNNGITVLDDAYNSNPEGARTALEMVRDFKLPEGGRRIVVTPGFVELGERQYEANRQLGREIAAAADTAVVVNRLNRQAILEGLAEAGFDPRNTITADSLREAAAKLQSIVRRGDIVLYENDLPDTFK